jgi:threonine dehydrogenase-like Zn-dependent dehydrogenase
MQKMKAARLVAAGKIVCEQATAPEPKDGEVLVKSELAAICGSDLHVVYAGQGHTPDGSVQYPCPHGYPGHEGLGTVVASKSPTHKVGQKVLCCPIATNSATFSEYQVLPPSQAIPLPAYNGPLEHLLMAQQLGTTIFALRQNPVDVVGKTVLVMGQGSAGNFFAYNLKRAGAAKVIVSDLSEARLGAAKVFGADVAVKADAETVKQAVMDHTKGQGVDFLVEAVGSRTTLLQTVDLMKPDSTMLYFGLPDSNTPVPWNFQTFFRKRLRAYSTYGAQVEADTVSFKLALHLVATRQIDVASMISHRLPLDDIDKAMRIAQDRSDNALKVLVTI